MHATIAFTVFNYVEPFFITERRQIWTEIESNLSEHAKNISPAIEMKEEQSSYIHVISGENDDWNN